MVESTFNSVASNLDFQSPSFTAEIRGTVLSRSSNLLGLKFPSSIKEFVVNSNLWSLRAQFNVINSSYGVRTRKYKKNLREH